MLCVPVKAHKAVVGVIQLINKTDGVFTDDDVTLTKLMATQIGAAVRSAQDYEAATRRHDAVGDELQRARQQLSEQDELSRESSDAAFRARLVCAYAGMAAAVTDIAGLATVVGNDTPGILDAAVTVMYIRDAATDELWCFRFAHLHATSDVPTLSRHCTRLLAFTFTALI